MGDNDSGCGVFIVSGVIVGFSIICCLEGLYGTPGPGWGSSACIVSSRTLQYTTEMAVSDASIPMDVTVGAGEKGGMFEVFVSAEYLGEGAWNATFRNTHTGDEAQQVLPSCKVN